VDIYSKTNDMTGSKQDAEALVNYIYDEKNSLGCDLNCVVPFAAIPENGCEID